MDSRPIKRLTCSNAFFRSNNLTRSCVLNSLLGTAFKPSNPTMRSVAIPLWKITIVGKTRIANLDAKNGDFSESTLRESETSCQIAYADSQSLLRSGSASFTDQAYLRNRVSILFSAIFRRWLSTILHFSNSRWKKWQTCIERHHGNFLDICLSLPLTTLFTDVAIFKNSPSSTNS